MTGPRQVSPNPSTLRNNYTNVSHSKQQVSNATSQTLYEHVELSVFLRSSVAEGSGRRPARLSVHVLMCYSWQKIQYNSDSSTNDALLRTLRECVVQLQRTAVSFCFVLGYFRVHWPSTWVSKCLSQLLFHDSLFVWKTYLSFVGLMILCTRWQHFTQHPESFLSGTAQILQCHYYNTMKK